MKIQLLEKENVEGNIWAFTFEPPLPLVWKAGQQMVVTLNHPHPDNLGIKRTLSIATAPFEEKIMFLTHCDRHSSSFKQALLALEKGDTVEVSDAQGDFVITDPTKEYTFVAAGVGIAPFRAMLMDLDYHNQPINILLIYSHTSQNFLFKDEIEELVERHANFKVFYNIDPTEKERGRIKEAIVGREGHPIYMSGIYIRKIATMFDSRDTSPRHLVHEGQAVSARQNIGEDEVDGLISLMGKGD